MNQLSPRAVALPPVTSRRLPFAVGLALTPATPVEHEPFGADLVAASGRRVALALTAHDAGFYLLDVVEAAGRHGVTLDEWAWLWSLAMRTDAEAVLTLGLGEADRAGVELMAEELRLVVRVVPAEAAVRIIPAGLLSTASGVPAADRRTGEPTSER